MSRFPHESLEASDCIPRIQAATAAEVCDLVGKMMQQGKGNFATDPAICIAIFQGPLVKWLTEEDQVKETIRRLRAALFGGGCCCERGN